MFQKDYFHQKGVFQKLIHILYIQLPIHLKMVIQICMKRTVLLVQDKIMYLQHYQFIFIVQHK